MGIFLGVTISDSALSANWIEASTCVDTFDPVQLAGRINTYGAPLINGVYAVNVAAADYGTIGFDVVEENLWGLLAALDNLNYPLQEWQEQRDVLAANTANWPFDGWTDTPESCGLTANELASSYYVMHNFVTELNNAYNALYNTMAAFQAYEEQEVEEEILEGTINAQINDNNQAVLDNAKSAQRLNILNTLYSFQTFILPALIIVVGYMLYKRMR